eukprot:2321823-Rhodomonas_salina.1
MSKGKEKRYFREDSDEERCIIPPDLWTFMEDDDCYVTHRSHADTNKVQGMQSGVQGRGGVAKK